MIGGLRPRGRWRELWVGSGRALRSAVVAHGAKVDVAGPARNGRSRSAGFGPWFEIARFGFLGAVGGANRVSARAATSAVTRVRSDARGDIARERWQHRERIRSVRFSIPEGSRGLTGRGIGCCRAAHQRCRRSGFARTVRVRDVRSPVLRGASRRRWQHQRFVRDAEITRSFRADPVQATIWRVSERQPKGMRGRLR